MFSYKDTIVKYKAQTTIWKSTQHHIKVQIVNIFSVNAIKRQHLSNDNRQQSPENDWKEIAIASKSQASLKSMHHEAK